MAAFVMYLLSTPHQVGTGDTAEYQTVPYILGIAHPTGFPLFTLTGWLVSHALAIDSVAWRLNAFAAFCTALTAGGVALLATALGTNAVAALAAALTFAFGTVVWTGAVHATPHALSGLFIVGVLTGAVTFARNGNLRALYAACGCSGLGLATQPETIWAIPAIAVALLWQRGAVRRSVLARAAVLMLAPLVLYAYFPIRSAMVAAQHLDPSAGAPLFGAGRLDWDIDSPRTLDGFLNEVLARHEYAGSSALHALDPRPLPGAAALFYQHALEQYGAAALVLAFAGIVALAQGGRRALSVLAAGTVGGLMFAYVYRTDIELERYFLVAFAVTAVLAAASTQLRIARVRPAYVAACATLALAVTAAATLWSDRGLIAQLRYGGAQATIDAVAHDVPDGSVVVAAWYDATTLGYGSAVERALGTRTIVAALPDEYVDQYAAWAKTRRITVFTNWGTAPYVAGIPPAWVRERPSSLPLHRVVDVRPRSAGG